MHATQWEFRHRTWFFFAIFCIGLAFYWIDPHNSGEVIAGWLRAQVVFLRENRQQSVVRGVFLVGALVVGIGAMIRAWAGAYIRAEVLQDSKLRTEKLVADGPFRHMRNPLYLGILIGVFGAGVMCSPMGWAVQVGLAIVFVYRLILREEAELLNGQSESFRDYCRAVPRLLPAIKPRIAASGAHPHWGEGIAVQVNWWGIALANVIWAISLRPWLAFTVGGVGFVLSLGQKYVLKTYARPIVAAKSVKEIV
jgi:protein-S-isoprenylcysteine O-methyltransferase Ste14